MLRRHFLALPGAALLKGAVQQRVALTIDDFAWRPLAEHRKGPWQEALLEPLKKRGVKAAAFVAGSNIDDPEGKALVRKWLDAGHLIGNHTYAHQPYHRTPFAEFSADVLKNDALLKSIGARPKYFRFPMLREGETREKRDQMRGFLKARGYANGPVTIDTSDWYIDRRLRAALKANPQKPLDGYRIFYIGHMLDRARFYTSLANTVGVSAPHTLLLHYNLLNALFLEDLMRAFEERGGFLWIDAATAFADPFFKTNPDVVPAGESLLYATAKEKGKLPKGAPYPMEDGDQLKGAMDQLGL